MIKGKKIADYINEETVNLDLKSKVKNMVIKELYGAIKDLDSIKNTSLSTVNNIQLYQKIYTNKK